MPLPCALCHMIQYGSAKERHADMYIRPVRILFIVRFIMTGRSFLSGLLAL